MEGSSSIPEGDMVTEKLGKNVDSFKQKDKEDALLLCEKDKVTEGKDEKVIIEEKKDLPVQQENKEESNNIESNSKQGDQRKKSDNNREVANLKPKGRGGFGKPLQSSEDNKRTHYDDRRPGGKRFPDRRRANDEKGRDRGEYYEEKHFSRNYSNQRSTGRDTRNREKEQTPHSQHDDRDTGTRWYSQDDRRKRFGERDDKRFSRAKVDGRNPRGGHRSSYPTRGRFSKPPMRRVLVVEDLASQLGVGDLQIIIDAQSQPMKNFPRTNYESDSSSYTTATSASEERRDDKTSDKESDLRKEKESSTGYDRTKAPSRSTRSPLRGKVSMRAGPRGAGGFGRSRRSRASSPFSKATRTRKSCFVGVFQEVAITRDQK